MSDTQARQAKNNKKQARNPQLRAGRAGSLLAGEDKCSPEKLRQAGGRNRIPAEASRGPDQGGSLDLRRVQIARARDRVQNSWAKFISPTEHKALDAGRDRAPLPIRPQNLEQRKPSLWPPQVWRAAVRRTGSRRREGKSHLEKRWLKGETALLTTATGGDAQAQ